MSGIKDADVADKPNFGACAHKIWDLLEGSILIAHNFNFDFGFLRAEFQGLEKLVRRWARWIRCNLPPIYGGLAV